MQMTVGPSRSSYGPLPRSRIACARQWNVASAYTAGVGAAQRASARTHDDHGDDGEEAGADPTDAVAEIEQRERQAGENDGEVEPLATSARPGVQAACRRGTSARWRRRPGPVQRRADEGQGGQTFGSTLTGSAMPGLVRRGVGVGRTLVGAGALQQRLSGHDARRCERSGATSARSRRRRRRMSWLRVRRPRFGGRAGSLCRGRGSRGCLKLHAGGRGLNCSTRSRTFKRVVAQGNAEEPNALYTCARPSVDSPERNRASRRQSDLAHRRCPHR